MRIQKEFEYSQPLIYNFYVPNEQCISFILKILVQGFRVYWFIQLFYKHFIGHLIKSINRYIDGIIQPAPFWDFPL